jgi:hypothetical protein
VPLVVDSRHPRFLTAMASARNTPRVGRELLVTFIVIPLVFVASAGFMWSRPLETPKAKERVDESPIHSRFHRIVQEMAGQSSVKVNGIVRKPEKRTEGSPARVDAKALVSQTLVEKTAAPVGTPPARSPSELAALEKQVHLVLKRHGKPVQNGKELAGAIVREALAQDYDPVFVAAVIKSESAFNSLARSNKGAQGLMQIMPKTGAWLADKQAIPRRTLTDPKHNLKLGISYLKQLESEYGGNRVLTLIAYNWGPGHVASASAGGRRVPGEVMQYAVKILNDYRRWSSELRGSVG